MTRLTRASLLAFVLSLCGAAVVITHLVQRHAPPPAPRELCDVVNHQLTALRSADFSSAYRHAASGVQERFTLTEFETMIRRGYSDMTRARHVEFGLVKRHAASGLVQVFFFSENGSVRTFVYNLICENGVWKIAGVEETGGNRSRHQVAGSSI